MMAAMQYYRTLQGQEAGPPIPIFQNSFSFRKVNLAYSGSCIRVRRSSDNTELDIGFSSGLLDEVGLLAFVGAGNGFISIWYDQQILPYNLLQATLAAQPKIVTSGVVEKYSGKVCAVFSNAQRLGTAYQTLLFAGTRENQLHYVTEYTKTGGSIFVTVGLGGGTSYGVVSAIGSGSAASQGWQGGGYSAIVNKGTPAAYTNRGNVYTRNNGYKIISESHVGAAAQGWGFGGYSGFDFNGRVFEINNIYALPADIPDATTVNAIQDEMNSFYSVY